MEEEKRAWFLKWEEEVAMIARRAGVAEALGVPSPVARRPINLSVTVDLPKRAGLQPPINLGAIETRTAPMLATTASKFVFTRETWGPARPQSIDLPPGEPRD
jgi:hypothetical protein